MADATCSASRPTPGRAAGKVVRTTTGGPERYGITVTVPEMTDGDRLALARAVLRALAGAEGSGGRKPSELARLTLKMIE